MRLSRLFAYVFAAFVFLTIGSLMIIVSLHVLSMEDALLKVEELFESRWQSTRMGIAGLIFVIFGLVFSKLFVKSLKSSDDVILYGKWGTVHISIRMIEALVRKVLRKFEEITALKVSADTNASVLQIKADVSVETGSNVQELMNSIQVEITKKIRKVLGAEIDIDLVLKIGRISEKTQLSKTI